MAANKLETFILVNLFKYPALLGVVALACVFVAQTLGDKVKEANKFVALKSQIDTGLVDKFGWMADPKKGIQGLIKDKQLNAQMINGDPLQFTADINTVTQLEGFGATVNSVEVNNGQATVALQFYNPVLQ